MNNFNRFGLLLGILLIASSASATPPRSGPERAAASASRSTPGHGGRSQAGRNGALGRGGPRSTSRAEPATREAVAPRPRPTVTVYRVIVTTDHGSPISQSGYTSDLATAMNWRDNMEMRYHRARVVSEQVTP